MLHFTPIQEVGQSGSAYSLYNQNMISNRIFSAHHVVDAALSGPRAFADRLRATEPRRYG